MTRLLTYIIIGVIVVLIGFVAFFVVTNNVLGKPCPSNGCAEILVSGGASLQGKIVGNPTEVIFKGSNGQTYLASVTASGVSGAFNYGPINLPNDENYNVTIESGFGSSCNGGSLNLNSNVQGVAWNANC
jgi:hypothetical protein